MPQLAPIALFVYNRPSHTKQTLSYLKRNKLFNDSELYIFCDGPKADATNEQMAKIDELHSLFNAENLPNIAQLIKQEKNIGLANSITFGINKVFELHEKVIVIEDDILTSPDFLEYMNKALNHYENEERVMHISGFIPPINTNKIKEDYVFVKNASCWGWGTWKKAWANFPKSDEEIAKQIPNLNKRDFDYGNNYHRMLNRALKKEIDSWAIKWYYAIYQKKGLCLHPIKSLTKNIGLDNSGIHSSKSHLLDKGKLNTVSSYNFPDANEGMNFTAEKKFRQFFFMNRLRKLVYQVFGI